MKYICERCIHKYKNGGCIVPCTIGYTGKCYYFYEKPKHTTEQTNEEWFCGLSTKEKAKVLSNATYSSVFCFDILILGKEAEQKKWELWLKEKRNEIC